MSFVQNTKAALTKYWSALVATIFCIYWLGGFVITVNQIQTDQTAMRIRIVEVEQRQQKFEDKVNTQNIEVISRLSRMEATLEEIKRKR